jgi:hypothetical protein
MRTWRWESIGSVACLFAVCLGVAIARRRFISIPFWPCFAVLCIGAGLGAVGIGYGGAASRFLSFSSMLVCLGLMALGLFMAFVIGPFLLPGP